MKPSKIRTGARRTADWRDREFERLIEEKRKIMARLKELDTRQIASYIQPVSLDIFPGG